MQLGTWPIHNFGVTGKKKTGRVTVTTHFFLSIGTFQVSAPSSVSRMSYVDSAYRVFPQVKLAPSNTSIKISLMLDMTLLLL